MPSFSTNQYAWKDVSIVYQGRTLVGVQGVKYKVTVDREPVYGRGSKALAIQSGNEKVEGEIMLLQTELEALRAAVKAIDPTKKITDFPSDIVISYGSGNTAVTDTIRQAYITEYEKGLEQEDKFMTISLPFVALDVDEGV